jgi:Leucine-rich repeat (LRR) protein
LAVLRELFDATGGSITWNRDVAATWFAPGASMSAFTGIKVTCVAQSVNDVCYVSEIALSSVGLTGTLPASIGKLHALTKLDVWSNQISGIVPSSVCDPSGLSYLDLSTNHFTGNFSFLAKCHSAQILYLSDNHFRDQTSTIAPFLCSFPHLDTIYMGNLDLTGDLSFLAGCKALKDLHLPHNRLSGGVSWVANLNFLETLELSFNLLSDTLEPFQNLTANPNFYWLELQHNQFVGTVPAFFGKMTRLQILNLQSNQLNGTLGSFLENMTSLTQLVLDSNRFVGSLRTQSLRNLVKLSMFRLSGLAFDPPQFPVRMVVSLFGLILHKSRSSVKRPNVPF